MDYGILNPPNQYNGKEHKHLSYGLHNKIFRVLGKVFSHRGHTVPKMNWFV